jgi:hypothetical protein
VRRAHWGVRIERNAHFWGVAFAYMRPNGAKWRKPERKDATSDSDDDAQTPCLAGLLAGAVFVR